MCVFIMHALFFTSLGFDSLIKGINKSKAIVEKEGFPSFFVRALVELEVRILGCRVALVSPVVLPVLF